MEMNFSSKSLHRVYACLSYYCYGARRYCPCVLVCVLVLLRQA